MDTKICGYHNQDELDDKQEAIRAKDSRTVSSPETSSFTGAASTAWEMLRLGGARVAGSVALRQGKRSDIGVLMGTRTTVKVKQETLNSTAGARKRAPSYSIGGTQSPNPPHTSHPRHSLALIWCGLPRAINHVRHREQASPGRGPDGECRRGTKGRGRKDGRQAGVCRAG